MLVTHGCILAAALALPFGIAVGISPEGGLIALVFLFLMLIYIGFNIFSSKGGDAVVIKELHKRLQNMLVSWGCIDKNKLSKVCSVDKSSNESENNVPNKSV